MKVGGQSPGSETVFGNDHDLFQEAIIVNDNSSLVCFGHRQVASMPPHFVVDSHAFSYEERVSAYDFFLYHNWRWGLLWSRYHFLHDRPSGMPVLSCSFDLLDYSGFLCSCAFELL